MNGRKIWMITSDVLAVGSMGVHPNESGTWGEAGFGCCRYLSRKPIGSTHNSLTVCPIAEKPADALDFRILDDDDEVYYLGWMTKELFDSEDILSPLDDFASPNAGVTTLQVKENGRWTTI